ncbi:hypothetical protein IL306_001747 [Fusarium sp. DS 682]|nr:hypothetical protein IL306_001747 [Fusarium sp. DS 682]
MKILHAGVPGLPKTFQDAISATRKLGYRYLWIDSLCILQDDQQDWAREAALMHKVYTNAECNLAAEASQDSSGGLFFKREGLHGQCVAKNTRKDVTELFVDCDIFMRDIQNDPLQKVTSLKKQEMDTDAEISQTRFRLWVDLVADYTHRMLTKSSDILPALSGIAKWLQPHLGNPVYLAGLWNNGDLHRQLAWYADTPNNSRPHYRAQSWSWASIDGQAGWISECQSEIWYEIFTPGPDIIDASATLDGDDPTGPVTGGHLLITGSMARVKSIDYELPPSLCREDEMKVSPNRVHFHTDVSGF